jgi:two-component system LytT family response regulator
MTEKKYILFNNERGKIEILINDIYRIRACREYSTIYTKSGKHMVCKHLKYFEKLLEDNWCFFRPHKSDIINIKQIKKVTNGKICTYFMNDGYKNNLSRRKKNLFLAIYKTQNATVG